MEKLLDDQERDARQRDEGITGSGSAGEASGRRRESKRCVELSTSRNKRVKERKAPTFAELLLGSSCPPVSSII